MAIVLAPTVCPHLFAAKLERLAGSRRLLVYASMRKVCGGALWAGCSSGSQPHFVPGVNAYFVFCAVDHDVTVGDCPDIDNHKSHQYAPGCVTMTSWYSDTGRCVRDDSVYSCAEVTIGRRRWRHLFVAISITRCGFFSWFTEATQAAMTSWAHATGVPPSFGTCISRLTDPHATVGSGVGRKSSPMFRRGTDERQAIARR